MEESELTSSLEEISEPGGSLRRESLPKEKKSRDLVERDWDPPNGPELYELDAAPMVTLPMTTVKRGGRE